MMVTKEKESSFKKGEVNTQNLRMSFWNLIYSGAFIATKAHLRLSLDAFDWCIQVSDIAFSPLHPCPLQTSEKSKDKTQMLHKNLSC